MGRLQEMTVSELRAELAQVEEAIRTARIPTPTPMSHDGSPNGWEHLAVLARREQEIVTELRRRD